MRDQMLTLAANPDELSPVLLPAPVESYLSRFVGKLRTFALLRAAGMALAFVIVWTLLCCVLDRLWQLPSNVRMALLILQGCAVIAILFRPLRVKLSRQIDWTSAANEVERRNKRFAESLQTVTSQLISPARYRGSETILQDLVVDVSAKAADEDPAALLIWREVYRPWLIALAGLALMAGLSFSPWLGLPRLIVRYYAPLANAAPATTTRIIVSPGSVDVMRGGPVAITAEVENLSGNLLKLHTSGDDEEWIATAMTPAGPGRFVANISSVEKDLRYRLSGGDAQTETYLIRALQPPTITDLRVQYLFPEYMNRTPITVASPDGFIEVPLETTLRIVAQASEPLKSADLIAGATTIEMTPSSAPAAYEGEIKVNRDAIYSLKLISQAGASGAGPDIRVRAIADRPPEIRLIYPSADVRLRPRDIFTMQYLAIDDFGLSELAAQVQVNFGDVNTLPIALRSDDRRQESVFRLDLAMLSLQIGDIVAVKMTASDRAEQTSESQTRIVLISPQSVEMDTHLRILELNDAAKFIETMVGHWKAAQAAAERAGQSSLKSSERRVATSEADREVTAAGESASLALGALLRTIIHAEDQRLCDALASFADEVQVQKDSAQRLRRMIADDAAEMSSTLSHIQLSHEQSRALLSKAQTILSGERATALLAEHENLLASDVRRELRPESEDDRATALARAREEIASAARDAGLDPGAGDLLDRLRLAAEARGRLIAGHQPLSFIEASRQWSIDRSEARLPIAGRLETAAQAEAVRPDSDMNRAHDLELSSRAARALDDRARVNTSPGNIAEYPGALGALEAEHRLRRESELGRDEVGRMRASAADARRMMALWADSSESIAQSQPSPSPPGDRQLALQASAEMANRNYEAAAALDEKLMPEAATQPASALQDSAKLALQQAKEAMKQAQSVDTLLAEQEEIRKQTAKATSENTDDAIQLAKRQEELAKAIDENREKAAAESSKVADTRESAIEAVGHAQVTLAGMPHQFSAASEAAQRRREAAHRANVAAQALANAPADQQAAAKRIVDEAQRQLQDAERALASISEPIQPTTIEQLATTLVQFAPETSAAETALRQTLAPSLAALNQALSGDDTSRIDRTTADVRRAIEQVQHELRRAQDDLMDQDPLTSANWFARAAAVALGQKPPDLVAAEAHQQKTSAALGKAWNDATRRAAEGRLSSTASMAWLYRLNTQLHGAASPEMADRALPDVPAVRQWGQPRPLDRDESNTTLRETDPRGYEEAIKLYFEALGQSEKK